MRFLVEILLITAGVWSSGSAERLRNKKWVRVLTWVAAALYTLALLDYGRVIWKSTSPYLEPLLVGRTLLITYVVLWTLATVTAVAATRGLYAHASQQSKSRVLTLVALSVVTFIVGFASAYLDISLDDPRSFSTGAPLSPVSALYFSIVTFATVGYGDIAPLKDTARILVCIEILFSMLYAVLMFSVVAGFIRQDRN